MSEDINFFYSWQSDIPENTYKIRKALAWTKNKSHLLKFMNQLMIKLEGLVLHKA